MKTLILLSLLALNARAGEITIENKTNTDQLTFFTLIQNNTPLRVGSISRDSSVTVPTETRIRAQAKAIVRGNHLLSNTVIFENNARLDARLTQDGDYYHLELLKVGEGSASTVTMGNSLPVPVELNVRVAFEDSVSRTANADEEVQLVLPTPSPEFHAIAHIKGSATNIVSFKDPNASLVLEESKDAGEYRLRLVQSGNSHEIGGR